MADGRRIAVSVCFVVREPLARHKCRRILGIADGGTLSRHGRRIRHRRSTDPAHMNAEDERICIFMVTTDGKHVIIVVNKKGIKQWGGD